MNRTKKNMRRFAFLLFLAVAASAAPGDLPLHTAVTKGGIRFGWVGERSPGPAPTVFFLGGAIEDSLVGPQYTEAIRTLGPAVLCVTFDIPGFGEDRREGEPGSISTWRYRLERGQDLTGDFVRRASAVLDYLIAEGFTDPKRVAAFGTSRGGFVSLHFAAADRRVTQVAGFAPVTDLFALREFATIQNEQPARAVCAARIADRLTDRSIWIMIGSTDFRVSTQRATQFAERVVEAALAQGRAPNIELHIASSGGHALPPGAYEAGARWLRKQWDLDGPK
jgi:pimeloyl-ACP methyl ester carboxylesterase